MPFLKIAATTNDTITIEGYGVPFGGPIKGKDMHGQYFSKNTDFALDLIPDGQRPLLYQHGLDKTLKTSVIGRWSVKKIDDGGVWVSAQLNARSEYINEIKELLDQDALGFSSGTMGHLVQVSPKSGEILKWALVELSLTPNPANPNAYVVKQRKSAKSYVKALLEEEQVLTATVTTALPDKETPGVKDETEMAKSVRVHMAAARGIVNAVKCGEAPVAMMFDALADILENLDKTMHGENGEPMEMEEEGHEDEAEDRALIEQVVDEKLAKTIRIRRG